ncbi:MAG: DUF4411 family protein [bacterium]
MAKYSIDTSSILHAWRRSYPPNSFPSLWQNIEELINRGDLIATEAVLFELEPKDDEVYKWAKSRIQMFVSIDERIQEFVAEIMRDYPNLVDYRRMRSAADPFVIALAKIENCSVVTNENVSVNPEKPKIPNVCRAMGILSISFLELISEQAWKF